MSGERITATDMTRALVRSNAEIVTTHVPHIVGEQHDEDTLTTACGYHLKAHQYGEKQPFSESKTSVTHLCQHCTAALRDDVETGEVVA